MKRFSWFYILLIFLLTGCNLSYSGFACKQGICVRIEIEEPVEALKPAVFMISVKTEKDIANLGLSVYGQGITILDIVEKPDSAILADEDERGMGWWIDTKGGEKYIITGHVLLAKPTVSYGIFSYGLIAAAGHPLITLVTDSITIYLDAEGKQVEESQAIKAIQTGFPLPTPRPDLTIVPETPMPTVVWPTQTPLPSPSTFPTLPAYP